MSVPANLTKDQWLALASRQLRQIGFNVVLPLSEPWATWYDEGLTVNEAVSRWADSSGEGEKWDG